MDTKLVSVIEKIKKLLALSASTNSANEAAVAAGAANKLLDEYRLSEADLSSEDVSNPMVNDDDYIYQTGKITPWKQQLVLILSQHYGVACMNHIDNSMGRKFSRFKLLGRKNDIEIVKYFFSFLVLQCQHLADIEAKGNGRVYISSYCFGFVKGIEEQLKASRIQAKQTATSSAIIKIDSRLQESLQFMNSKYNLRPSPKSSIRIDNSAYTNGVERGRNMHLGNSIGAKSPKLLGN